MALRLTSPAFANEDDIPKKYTADGEDINPPLRINGQPEGAVSLVLIVDDPDAATDPKGPGKTFDHWVVFNIPAAINDIAENSLPDAATQGKNGYGKNQYAGPNPPTGSHRYFFRLYVLSAELDLDEDASKSDVLEVAEPLSLEQTELVGTYQKGAQ